MAGIAACLAQARFDGGKGGGSGLPLGLQLAAPAGEDDRLLAVAAWCESCFGFKGLV